MVYRGDVWNPERDEKLVRLWFSKAPVFSRKDIAETLGITPSAVSSRAYRLGLPPRHNGAPPDLPVYEPPPDPEALAPTPVGKVRTCMCCKRQFWSPHAGVQFCDNPGCRAAASGQADYSIVWGR